MIPINAITKIAGMCRGLKSNVLMDCAALVKCNHKDF